MVQQPYASIHFLPQNIDISTRQERDLELRVARSHAAKVTQERRRRRRPDGEYARACLLPESLLMSQVNIRSLAWERRRVDYGDARLRCSRCIEAGTRCGNHEAIRPITLDVWSDPVEERSHNYFKERSTPVLSSFAQFTFWDRAALQGSYHEPAIRRMLAAIGAFHESVEQRDQARSRQLHVLAVDRKSSSATN